MADRIFDSGWVDRYVRNALTEDEAMDFEAALFDSEPLRGDVEAALALQSILTLDQDSDTTEQFVAHSLPRQTRGWQPLATAASLLIGIVGVGLWFSSVSEVSQLQDQIEGLSRASGEIVIKRLDVTRSSANHGIPVLKPPGNALLVLDIELGSQTRSLDQIQINLVDRSGTILASWSGDARDRDRVSIGVRSSQLDDDTFALEFRQSEGQLLESRQLEIIANH